MVLAGDVAERGERAGMGGDAAPGVDQGARGLDLSVRIGGLTLANPVMPASGCFGPELAGLVPTHRLGAVVTKTVFAQPRPGNPAHRLTETSHGMLNSVGIPSQGVAAFVRDGLPAYRSLGVPVVVSVGGLSESEYWRVADALAGAGHDALEVNVSCPNLERGGVPIGADPEALRRVVAGVVARAEAPVLVKLAPDLAAIDASARAAAGAGAAAVTVCNSFPSLAVDAVARAPRLGNGIGGLSGPAVKPMVLRLVWQAARAVDIPVIGCGGIAGVDDVAEFLVAGASAVQVGTATFARPFAMAEIVRDLPAMARRLGIDRLTDLIGTLTF